MLSSSHIYLFHLCMRVLMRGNLDQHSNAYFYERYPSCAREERVGVLGHDGRLGPDVGKSQYNEHNVAADMCNL